MEHNIAFLEGSELGLDRDAAAALAAEMWTISLDRDEFLCLQGEPSDRFFVVRRGSLAVQSSSSTGRELVFTSIGPGAPIGEVSVFDASPRSAAIRAITPSEVLAIGRESFLHLVGVHPSIGLALAAHLARIVRRLSENVEGASFLPLSERLLNLLLLMSAGDAVDVGAPRSIVATQQQLADRLGSSRESVNKLLRGWAAQDLAELGRGSVSIPDVAALQAHVHS